MIIQIVFSKRTIFIAALYLMFAIACTQLPLFNTLGYEFAGLTGIFVSLISVFLFSPWIKENLIQGKIIRLYLDCVCVQIILLLIPFIVLVINAYFVRNCSLLTGALFFLLIPAITSLFTTALVILLTQFFKKYVLLIYYFIIVILLIHPVIIILSQPQLFAYNHLFGMFIGFSWDESQPIFATLALYRIATIAYAILLICIASILAYRGKYFQAPRSEKQLTFFLSGISLMIILSGLFFTNELGFTTTANYAQKELGSSYQTKHFTIFYSSFSFTKDEILHVADEHEFRLYQVTHQLQVDFTGRITSYIYPSREIKKRLLGSETSQIARPWMNEIHLSSDYWESSLKHELVHIVAGSFAPYIVHAPVLHYLGLTEGLAMAIENDNGMRTLHQSAAAMKQYDLLPPVKSFLPTQGFWNNASQVSYVASGSFCRWLIDSYGINKIKKAYLNDDIETAYNLSLDSLQTKWIYFLDTVKRLEPDSLATLYAFKGQPLFRKVCARVLTEMNRSANEARRSERYEEALNLYEQSEAMSPNTSAVFGIVLSNFALEKYDSVIAITSRYFADSNRSYSLLPLYLWRGDAAWMRGDSSEAERSYQFIRGQNLYQSTSYDAEMKLKILHHPKVRNAMWRIISNRVSSSSNDDSVHSSRIIELKNILQIDSTFSPAKFLLATYLASDTDKIDEAIHILEKVNPDDPLLFRIKILRGNLFYRTKKYRQAQFEFESLLQPKISDQQRNDVIDHIERCNWKLHIQH